VGGVADAQRGSSSEVQLEELTPGVVVRGVLSSGPVTVQSVTWHGSNAMTVIYRDGDGGLGEQILYRDHEPGLRIDRPSTTQAFDGDAELFRLAAEALRIRMAAQFDPMLAVNTSDLEPLPHQIRAVYGELLPRTPLRFLLADDPGAGKTIMAGLYIKELLLRGDMERCLIVAPGSLVEQWQDELLDRFGLSYELLTRQMVDATIDGSVFDRHPRLIARMDQLARSEDLTDQLARADWDLVVVDEAHRMSAHYFGGELKRTKRYELGQLLGGVCRHLLLMTATPHAGQEESFQLFLALLDGDRFEGRFRDGVHAIDTSGLMRRMVKEELLTFDGKPLFPERRAYTVPYELSPGEQDLYEAVTQYVRDEMDRAERLKATGEGRRGNTVGFALTVLQRRLASSPEAILKSLERRHRRLHKRRQELASLGADAVDIDVRARLARILGKEAPPDEIDEELDDLTGSEQEEFEEDVVDSATAARTIAELDAELEILADLQEAARRVRYSGTDVKWAELRSILLDNELTRDEQGNLRKIIIFTEHRDTLNYLVDQIRALLGRDEAVVAIHGGVRREERRAVQEMFTGDKTVQVLVATDAAGEGLNLQRAHLMVNYDLPWNPNRIEQRFGRIHRIGQTEVCHLWNLVARTTREGQVFERLLAKIEEQRRAYAGKVFDVLGEAFEGRPLRTLLIEAIRYGDQPEVRDKLNHVIDATVGDGLDELIAERALTHDMLGATDMAEARRRMEEAQARRLQPHYIRAFFLDAFRRLGGRITERETGRFEITHVPADVIARDRQVGLGAPVLRRYERVTFDRELIRSPGRPHAALIAPGHPLLDAVVDLTVERHATLLKQGTILIDREDHGEQPRLLVALRQEITNGHQPPLLVSRRFDFVEIDPKGTARSAGPAPYLDYEPPTVDELGVVKQITDQPWLATGVERLATEWAIEHVVAQHLTDVRARMQPQVERSRALVKQRLRQEINYWDIQHGKLLDDQAAGKRLRIRPETAERRARDLERRLAERMHQLDQDGHLSARAPVSAGGALVIPQGLLDRLSGVRTEPEATFAAETAAVERRAVDAVMAAERQLGRTPREQARNNPGFDILSETPDGGSLEIEVKGRIESASDFVITRNEVLRAKNIGERYRLALVRVSDKAPDHDQVRYLTTPFEQTDTDDFRVTKFVFSWRHMWDAGRPPR
jgi:superfamily II DNA or RNA helicase